MKNFIFRIQPFEHRYICPDVLTKPKELFCLDQLNKDLSFKKTLARSRSYESATEFFHRLVLTDQVKDSGWITVNAPRNTATEQLWKMAMAQLVERVRSKPLTEK